jgi:hypothetical protein
MRLLWEKREKYENSPIVVYLLLAKASNRIQIVTETIDEAIHIPVIGNKQWTNVTQSKNFRSSPLCFR